MSKLRRILLLLFCGALLFLLQYVWLRPPPNFSARDDMFKTQGDGIVWQRYQGNRIVQQVKAQQATVFFAGTEQGGAYLDLGASPARVELQGEVLFASEGHVLRTTQAIFADGKVFSDAAVQIVGSRMRLQGHAGFSYTLADGQLTLLGEVEGEAYPAEHTR